jgi:thiol:disulfide interchange protein
LIPWSLDGQKTVTGISCPKDPSGGVAVFTVDKHDPNRPNSMRQVSFFLAIPICALALSGCDFSQLPALESDALAESSTATNSAEEEIVEFIQGYSRGLGEARGIEKPMLVFFSATESVYCTQMLEETFTDERVVGLSKSFICIKVDIGDEPSVCRQFHVESYPTVQFMSPKGVPLNRFTGKKEASQLAVQMQAALEAAAYRTGQTRVTTFK